MAQKFKDYYDILGIPFSASEAEIKLAYRKMARLLHPDMHPEDAESYTAKFQEITEAYEALSDNYKKEIYDQQYRFNVLGERPELEAYYYEPQYEYQAYQPPVESKRKTYASYATILLMVFYFIRMVSGSISAATDTKHDYNLPISTGVQQNAFFTPKDTLNSGTTNTNEIKRPW
ncbi:J domain-containing protein [Taibaiella lutea]|uniref:J domain-containing protein n=1 Tax=Taibaiella lutea TaxID=2608001 RepID=A0A5M6CEP8_9BACT|nr:DnaJ domain-containing protein [Taibaiella lutea]KAA5533668.1 J domain-containing protein [Taibaiella lutea]